MKNNLLVTMSGGTSTVINSTLFGIIKEVKEKKTFGCVYAGVPGLQGVLNKKIVNLLEMSNSQLEKMRNTPGSSTIGTSRISKLSSMKTSDLKYLFLGQLMILKLERSILFR